MNSILMKGVIRNGRVEVAEPINLPDGSEVTITGHVPDNLPGLSKGVPAGILRSQQAFWRDLPELLKNKKNHGKWVGYHGDERIGIATTKVDLVRECLRRGLKADEYDLDVIDPHALPPWEPEEIEPGGNEVDDELTDHQPGPGTIK